MNVRNIDDMMNKIFNINLSALYERIENSTTKYGYQIDYEYVGDFSSGEDFEEYIDLIDPDNGKTVASHNETCKVVDVMETTNGRYVIIYNIGMAMVDGLFNPMFALSEEEFWIASE